jgi:hypothetical protein
MYPSLFISICVARSILPIRPVIKKYKKLHHDANMNSIILPPLDDGLYPPMIPSRFKSI